MRSIYSFFIIVYTGLIYLVSPFNRKAYLWKSGRKGWAEKLANRFSAKEKVIWVHCASLGEFEQGRPVIEKVREKMPDCRILVTFFSPSGYEIRKDWPFADYICYLPADTMSNAQKFIGLVKPQCVLFIKYEFWNNYITLLHKKGIPVYLVSGIFRPDQHFFKWYGGFFRNILKKYKLIFVQDKLSAVILSGIGIDNVIISGDTRFDRVYQIAQSARDIPVIENFSSGEKVALAGSSWPQDEEIIARYVNNFPEKMKWIFAPHEIDQQRIEKLENLFRVKTVRYSGYNDGLADARVLIIDNIGLLSSAYRYASLAVVGGGFGKGIHNILEPACWGLPVLFGPNHLKFREALDLLEKGGAFTFSNYDEFARIADRLDSDSDLRGKSAEIIRNYILANRGATEIIVNQVLGKDINK
jgi:3-deoxy-D-manno-octulosonic-acid transferase